MVKIVLDDLRPEPRKKMRQNFDIEGIVHKKFVPPEQTVNGTFCCDVLRRMRGNIRRKCPDKWRNNTWALHHDNAPASPSLSYFLSLIFQCNAVPYEAGPLTTVSPTFLIIAAVYVIPALSKMCSSWL